MDGLLADITHWPPVDVLISFFSKDFPLAKAIAYTQLPNITRPPPISINSLAMQALLWDRRLVLAILDHIGVPTPMRAEVNRDGGPHVHPRLRERVRRDLGLVLPGSKSEEEETWGEPIIPDRWVQSRARAKASRGLRGEVPRSKEVILRDDGNAIIVGGVVIEKPFVEKPVDGEDHNVYIYHRNGGGRRLFRKVNSEGLVGVCGGLVIDRCVLSRSGTSRPSRIPRCGIREPTDPSFTRNSSTWTTVSTHAIALALPLLMTDHCSGTAEDIKIYTVGPHFSHAETRKSPVVDGLVRRNADGKETRFITQLSPEEKGWAKDIVEAFGQRVCGFDLLRCTEEKGIRSLIIDVNGWSFVKGNQVSCAEASLICLIGS
jgi:inositol hexakisphosphate/diphosphoinositol-pentakisphosphate kinase